MKKINTLLLALMASIASTSMQSCVDTSDETYYVNMPNALVTVKPYNGNKNFYMQLDESTTLLPVNMTASPFGEKEVRALVNYSLVKKESNTKHDYAVNVNWIDSILTKEMMTNLGEQNPTVYGTDPIEIVKDWVSVVEDGYLTLRFRTLWDDKTKHAVNLVATGDEQNPYKVTIFHDAKGLNNGITGDGIVAFRLTNLPDTKGETVKLTLEWNSFSGKKSTVFDYKTQSHIYTEQ